MPIKQLMTETNTRELLSVIVPLLNEGDALDEFFHTLESQVGIDFEVIFCDGGSSDETVSRLEAFAESSPRCVQIRRSSRGRGRQLNAGARTARGDYLLFLHVDSSFSDPEAFRKAVAELEDTIGGGEHNHVMVAGHFALRFRDQGNDYRRGYYYYESKARLDRRECTHGDQGFLMTRELFGKVGPFDEDFPLLEDTQLAEKIRCRGTWVLLPAEIFTSARRFEAEGLIERQVLNALIMNFDAIGWETFFRGMPGVYRSQDRTRRLQLLPFFDKIRELLKQSPLRQRVRLWYQTGCYVRPNAWQLAYAWDVRRNFRAHLAPGTGPTPTLTAFDRWYDRLTDHPPGRLTASALVWIWFYLTWWWLKARGQDG